MDRKINNPFVCWCVAGIFLLVLAGCGPGNGRQNLEGTVTLDGEPLAKGSIAFRPTAGTQSPTAGGRIVNGEFSISPEKGLSAGTFRVEITASRKTGRKVMDPVRRIEVDEMEQVIPQRYNRQSELTREITTDGPNQFTFELQQGG